MTLQQQIAALQAQIASLQKQITSDAAQRHNDLQDAKDSNAAVVAADNQLIAIIGDPPATLEIIPGTPTEKV